MHLFLHVAVAYEDSCYFSGAVPFGKEDPTDLERKKEDAEKSPASDPPGPEALPSSPPASPAAEQMDPT